MLRDFLLWDLMLVAGAVVRVIDEVCLKSPVKLISRVAHEISAGVAKRVV